MRNYLLLVVFITGACVLAIEVAATRILASYFGSTIYTVSSVISVILAALSLGYYLGGRLADARPAPRLFYLIITGSAFSVFIMQILIVEALPAWGQSLDLVYGPLTTSLLLFLLPSFLLGMLSPYAVKLLHLRAPSEGLATIAGKVFFWSTTGSIGGSLLTGFYLIPSFGLRQITLGIGLILLALGLSGLVLSRPSSSHRRVFLLGASGLLLLAGAWRQPAEAGLLYEDDGRYEHIRIYDGQYNGEAVRLLQQDLNTDSAISLESDELPFQYARYYRLLYAMKRDLRSVAVVGGGAYTIPRRLIEERPELTVDVAEVEPKLIGLAREYFGLPDTPRLRNFVMDGRRFLTERPAAYDAIFSDAYHSYLGIPAHLTTVEFFRTAKESLRPGGIFMVNVIGSLAKKVPSFALSEMKTLRQVFPNSYFLAVGSPSEKRLQNLIFVGVNSDDPIDFGKLRTPGSTVADQARSSLLDPESYDLERHKIFTDDFAPVERYTAEALRE